MEYALVTGGSRGIGKAICLRLADMGYNIILNYTSNDVEANKTKDLLIAKGVDVVLMKFDVSSTEESDAHIETWINSNKDKAITVLVNNAGIRKDNIMVFIQPEDWKRVIDITVDGFYNVTRHVVKSMLNKRKGRVVNIVSLSGLKGLPGQTSYSAAKGAVIAATKALAQNLTTKKEITVWLNHTLKNTIKLSYVKNSVQLRIKIFQNLSRLMLLLKDYTSLEAYLKSCLLEFENDSLFNKQTHEVKLQLLVYLCNASYMINKHTQSIQYANVFHKAIFEYDKALYNQYIFYYYNILVNNYSKTNALKAIDTLEEAQNEKQIKNNPNQYFYVLNNLAILNFDLKKHKQASKFFSQMYVSQNFKSFDKSFVVKLQLFELINRIELQDYEQCDKQVNQLYKLIDDVKEKESIKIDMAVLELINKFLNEHETRWRPLKTSIQTFVKKFNDPKDGTGLINYTHWIESKV